MLKKAGIIVAVAAAGVLAVSPLAFAGEASDSGHGHGHGHGPSYTKNISKTETSPSCSFGNASDGSSRQAAQGVSSPLLGLVGTAANAAAPITNQLNTPILSCNNFSDLVDLNSNNDTKTVDNSKNINKSSTDSSFFSFLGN